MNQCHPDKCIGCRTCRPLTIEDEQRIERALTRAGYPAPMKVSLRVVTRPPVPAQSRETTCAGTMTCVCRACSRARARIVPQGSGNADPFRRAA